jgi:hypothetical protein
MYFRENLHFKTVHKKTLISQASIKNETSLFKRPFYSMLLFEKLFIAWVNDGWKGIILL